MATPIPPQQDQPRPASGERTSRQSVNVWGLTAAGLEFGGFSSPPGATIRTYRRMLRNPTVKISRMASRAPIKAASWAYQSTSDDPRSKEAVQFIRDNLDHQRRWIVGEMMRAMDFGYQGFEKVFAAENGRLVLQKLKPLAPEITQIMLDPETGAFAGLKNGGEILGPEKSFWFAVDADAAEPYGIGRNESAREVWSGWNDIMKQVGRYARAAAVPIPIVRHPVGTSEDSSGSQRSNAEIARELVRKLQESVEGFGIPNEIQSWAEDLISQGGDPSRLLAWTIDFLEPKAKAGDDLILILRHLERLIARAWLMPERAMLEGEHGTKAEAGIHGDLALMIGEDMHGDIVECVNLYIVDQLLELNFGADAAGMVRIVAEPLIDERRARLSKLLDGILTQPANIDIAEQLLDIETLFDVTGTPKRQAAQTAQGIGIGAGMAAREVSHTAALRAIFCDDDRGDGGGNGHAGNGES